MATLAERLRGLFQSQSGSPPPAEEPTDWPRRPYSSLSERFTEVYRDNLWEDKESVSGPGSSKSSGSVIHSVQCLERAYRELRFRSMNDIPCGDFNWIGSFLKHHSDIKYRGFDVVSDLIAENNYKFGSQYKFSILDITTQVPAKADLILCKDLLNHLSYADISRAVDNMKKSDSSYLLLTNNFMDDNHKNEEVQDVLAHASRVLDLTKSPFNISRPLWASHYMGLWDLRTLTL